MLCVQVVEGGGVVVVDPQPVEVSACGLVLVSGAEAVSSPFSLSAEQGSQVAGAVLALWGLAFVIRMLIRAMSIDEVRYEE